MDTARVDVDGFVTLAGRAEPGATIEVLVGETLIGTISVGQDGSFASIFELSSSEEIRVVVLRTDNGDDFVYADHADKNNSNGTWMPLAEQFHIGYVHPPFFSKFEIQLLDWSLWNLFWWGHAPPIPLWAPFVNTIYFPLQRMWFNFKTFYSG